jgi:hypothetical protein
VKFGSSSLLPLLDDFLAGFRMLCLNPKTQTTDSKTMDVVGITIRTLLDTIKQSEVIHELAENLINFSRIPKR